MAASICASVVAAKGVPLSPVAGFLTTYVLIFHSYVALFCYLYDSQLTLKVFWMCSYAAPDR
jgi:hypothetical protein